MDGKLKICWFALKRSHKIYAPPHNFYSFESRVITNRGNNLPNTIGYGRREGQLHLTSTAIFVLDVCTL